MTKDKTAEASFWTAQSAVAVRGHFNSQNECSEIATVAATKIAYQQLHRILRSPGSLQFSLYLLAAEAIIHILAWYKGTETSEETADALEEIAAGMALEEAMEKEV